MPTPTSKILSDQTVMNALDPKKVVLTCGLHNYVPGRDVRRHTGCAKCIMCDFVYMFARVPPERQREELDRFEGLIRSMCELDSEGKLDISIQRHPTISIEKDALPDA